MADEDTFSPTTIEDLVNRSGRPRDEHGRFLAQPRDTDDQPGIEQTGQETQIAADGAQGGEAQTALEGAQADGQAQPQAAAATPPKTIADTGKPVPQTAPVAAVIAARKTGQAASDDLSKALARIAELEALTKAPPGQSQPAPAVQQPAQARPLTPAQRAARASVFDDENAFADGLLTEAEERAEGRAFGRQIAMSEMHARDRHPDFEEVMGTTVGPDGKTPDHKNWSALLTPQLWEQFKASPDPVRFAYETVKKHQEQQKLSDPAHIESLVEAKVAERTVHRLAKPAALALAPVLLRQAKQLQEGLVWLPEPKGQRHGTIPAPEGGGSGWMRCGGGAGLPSTSVGL